MTDHFNGFSDEFYKFFDDLKANNNREWFAKNKSRYQDIVQETLSAFISDIAPCLNEISPHYRADPRPNRGSMFRIYRDARFSKNKSPYKEHAAVQLRHHLGKDAHAPAFYVHIEKGNIIFGGGIWTPPSDILLKIRTRIVEMPKLWQDIVEDDTILSYFGGIKGDGLKRHPRGFNPDLPFIDDLKRKSFFAAKNISNPKITMNAGFIDEVEKSFKTAAPLMKFINDAIGVSF